MATMIGQCQILQLHVFTTTTTCGNRDQTLSYFIVTYQPFKLLFKDPCGNKERTMSNFTVNCIFPLKPPVATEIGHCQML